MGWGEDKNWVTSGIWYQLHLCLTADDCPRLDPVSWRRASRSHDQCSQSHFLARGTLTMGNCQWWSMARTETLPDSDYLSLLSELFQFCMSDNLSFLSEGGYICRYFSPQNTPEKPLWKLTPVQTVLLLTLILDDPVYYSARWNTCLGNLMGPDHLGLKGVLAHLTIALLVHFKQM